MTPASFRKTVVLGAASLGLLTTSSSQLHAAVAETALIPVPWTSQAPYGIWTQPWQDACEETTIAMVDAYYRKVTLSQHDSYQRILEIFDKKEALYGPSLDENASTMAHLVETELLWRARVVENPQLDMILEELEAGRPIIAPVYAPRLQNPHFRGTFEFHTVVITGYDLNTREFITNEPGTRRGHRYRYSFDTILQSMRDFVPNGTKDARRVLLFTEPHLLSLNNQLIKAPDDVRVYYIDGGLKRHIANEQVFLAKGWQWRNIKLTSPSIISSFREGPPVTL